MSSLRGKHSSASEELFARTGTLSTQAVECVTRFFFFFF